MKKIFLALFISFGFFAVTNAQTKASQTIKISVPTVQCDMCKSKIETYLKRYDGVTFINVNVKRKEAVVKYLTDRITEEDIKTAISNAGYDANEIAANPQSYQQLPACCKKPEPGSGMKKKN